MIAPELLNPACTSIGTIEHNLSTEVSEGRTQNIENFPNPVFFFFKARLVSPNPDQRSRDDRTVPNKSLQVNDGP